MGDDATKINDEKNNNFIITKKLFAFIITLIFLGSAQANPVLDNVAHGNVQVQQSPGNTQIQQNSQQAIINWRSFNIGAGERTHFQQPAGGTALNRINPNQGASQIFGHLSATGKIILVNQAGIFFGSSAVVDVGGIIASTSDISNENFLAGKYIFDRPGTGAVVNQGTIRAAEHGLVALIGNNVANDGTITAKGGHVVLASGTKFTVNLSGDNLIHFAVDEGSTSASVGPDGKTMKSGVSNRGMIVADGGRVIMTAKAASGVLDHVINMEGVAQARSVHQVNGEIILSGDKQGVVRIAGTLDASGKALAQKGGKVKITGQKILVDKGSKIDTSGDVGGGEILIGGNYQGKGPLPNATATVIMPDTLINADAITSGKGGTVIAWADDVTKFNGKISARGGALSGDGGFVETSGKNILSIHSGEVDLRAPHGKSGEWLLDPFNVTISSASSSNIDGTFAATGNDAVVNVSSLTAALGSGNVTVSTGSSGSQSGNITVSDAISWSSANVLTLSAANNIIINAAINASLGGLTLSAADTAASITTGSGGTIAVKNFILSQGRWSQNTASLPSFSVTNNFQLNSGTAFKRVSGGDGTSGTPYQITDVYGLQGITGVQNKEGSNLSFKLMNNIDASGTSTWNSGLGWVPLGYTLNSFTNNTYQADLDGQGFIVNGITINSLSSTYNEANGLGFIANIGSSGSVTNLGLTNASISFNNVGDIDLTGSGNYAVLAGSSNGPISNSFVSGTLTITGNTAVYIGGLVGQNAANISNSYSAVNITASSGSAVGGIVGASFGGTISNTYNIGSISANGALVPGHSSGGIGGLVGELANTTLSNSYSTASLTGSLKDGVVGTNDGGNTVSNLYFDNTIYSGSNNTGLGTGLSTANSLVSTNYSGFDIGQLHGSNTTAVWYMLDNSTRPILAMEYSLTPQTAHALQLIAKNTTALGVSSSYTVGRSIDMSGTSSASDVWAGSTGGGFVPIGTSSADWNGDFDGGSGSGYTISNLFINKNIADVGLFGYMDNASATVSNLTLANVNITQNINLGHVGSVVGGVVTGSVSNVSATGTVTEGSSTSSTNSNTVGGLIGYLGANSTLTGSNSAVTVLNRNQGNTGGLVGQAQGTAGNVATISNSYNTGTVSHTNTLDNATSFFGVGGIVGSTQYTNISGSYNTGTINGLIVHTGGLVGSFDGDGNISSSYNTGTINNTATSSSIPAYVGGLVGVTVSLFTGADISSSYNTGNVESTNLGSVGGLVGFANSTGTATTIDSSYNTGTIRSMNVDNNANDQGVGGIAGKASLADISASYNTGAIEGLTTQIAGLVGSFNGSTITTSYNLGDVTSSGTNCCVAVGGLVGRSGSFNSGLNLPISLTKSFNAGKVSTTDSSIRMGGLIGSFENGGTVEDNYNLGAITTSGSAGSNSIGGIIGTTEGTYSVQRNFAAGYIDAGTSTNVGGIVGVVFSGTPTNNFYNTDTASSGGSLPIAATGSGTSSGTGITTDAMMNQSTFSGFNFSSIWGIIEESSFPYLTSIFSSTPRAISGISTGSAGTLVTLTKNGTALTAGSLTQATTRLGANGFYYFLEGNSVYSTNDAILAYLASSGGSAVTVAPSSTGSITGLTLTSGRVNVGDDNSNTITNAILGTAAGSLGASNTLYSVSSGNLTLSGASTNFATTTANTTYDIAGNITNNAGAANTITFAGPVTFSGGTPTITSTGSQTYSNPVSLGVDAILSSGSGDITFSSTINGGQSLTLNSTGTTTLGGIIGGTTSLASLTTNSGGTTAINSTGITTTGAQTFNDNVTLGAIPTLTASSFTFGGTITNGGNTLTISNSSASNLSGLSGTGGLTKAGSGTLTLNAANTYSGATSVNAGTLSISNASGLGSTSGITVNGSGTLNIAGVTVTNTSNISLTGAITSSGTSVLDNAITLNSGHSISSTGTLTLNGILSGTNGLSKAGSGTVILGADNSYTGSTAITAGTLQLAAADRITDSSAVTVSSGATFDLNSFAETIGSLAGAGDVTLGSATLTTGGDNSSTSYSGSMSGTNGSLIKNGSGTMTLSGSNSYTGATTLNAGTLSLTSALNSTSSTSVNAGVLDLQSVTLTSPVTMAGGTLTASGTSGVTGAMTLSSNTTISGSGDLTLGTIDGASSLTLGSFSAVDLSGLIGNSTPLTSLTSNATSTTFSGGGASTSGNQTYNNGVTLGAGAALSSSGGSLTFNNNVTLTGNPSLTATMGNIIFGANITGAGRNLTLIGGSGNNTFTFGGAFNLNSIFINGGSAGSDTISLQAHNNSQSWSISGANLSNSGSVSGLSGISSFGFSSIQNMMAGLGNNTFTFADGASIAGTISGGSTSAMNRLVFTAYTSPVTIDFSGDLMGAIRNNSQSNIALFNQISAIDGSPFSILMTAPNKLNIVNITGSGQGVVGDPTSFTNVAQIVGRGNTQVIFPNGSIFFTSLGSTSGVAYDITFSDISGGFSNYEVTADSQTQQEAVTATTTQTATTTSASPQQSTSTASQVFSEAAATTEALLSKLQEQSSTELNDTKYSTKGSCGI